MKIGNFINPISLYELEYFYMENCDISQDLIDYQNNHSIHNLLYVALHEAGLDVYVSLYNGIMGYENR